LPIRLLMESDLNKRVAWLLNHTTLREFEVPLLRSLGLEVYCPKRFPRNADNRSASVSYEFDGSLTITEAELKTLNEFDFYSDTFTPSVRCILNERFGTLLVAYMFPMLEQVLANYRGRILLRAFGSTHPTYTYYSYACEVASPAFQRRLARVSDRFWFAQAYPNLKTIEPPFIQRRSAYLPLGLPERIIQHHNRWVGGNSSVLFVCPEIETYDDNKKIYEEFKTHFGDLQHVICGAQSRPHSDPAVLGKVDDPTYDHFFRTCDVMFYHSELPRHLHYHPIEAICYGMPVVYMQKGMLGGLTTRKLPGACDSLEEARSKVRRLVERQDSRLLQEICESQAEIYRLFTRDFAIDRWRIDFVERILGTDISAPVRSGRVAILPLTSDPSIYLFCSRLKEQCGERVQCRIGSLEPWNITMDTAMLQAFNWRPITSDQLHYTQQLSGYAKQSTEATAIVPDDGICDFMDCDSWVVVGDRCSAPIASVKPYVFIYTPLPSELDMSDLMHRSTVISLQNAEQIFVQTAADRDLLIKEFGISQDWIVLLDNDFSGDRLWRVIENIP
jgi:hypothetical protein